MAFSSVRITLALFSVLAPLAGAYRVLTPEHVARRASEEEMMAVVQEGDMDMVLLGGAAVLLLAACLHLASGSVQFATGSALAGVVAAAQAVGLLEETLFIAAACAGLVAAACSALASMMAKPAKREKMPKKVE
eukprot:gb/GFBE01021151.1/.p1 GENE.gb/GFBE01021151.1/~~gb/GFBE01021151.1/.p1  ORF type:complete len:134 (+),score=33.97 gb/GFBE01021151.1/:1-402(+)